MKKGILLLFAIVALVGCKKEDVRPECEKNNTCQVVFINTASEEYSVDINNGKFSFSVSARSRITKTLPAGFMKVSVTPYLWKPGNTTKNFDGTMLPCKSYDLMFP